MSRAYEAPREGLNYDVYGGSVPAGMLYRIRHIEGLSKQTLSIVPNSGQGSVYNGNKIIVSLPMNSLLDFGTFEMNFYGKTAHNGAANGNQKITFSQDFFLVIYNLLFQISRSNAMDVVFKTYLNIIIFIMC